MFATISQIMQMMLCFSDLGVQSRASV